MNKKDLPSKQERQANTNPEDSITMLALESHVIETMAKALLPQAREAFNNADIRQAYEEYLAGKEKNK